MKHEIMAQSYQLGKYSIWLLLALLSLGLLAGCQRQVAPPGSAQDKSLPDSLVVVPLASDTLLIRAEPILLASLRRAPCYGRCPVYEVQFFYNGDAVFYGERNVKMQGIYLAQAPDSLLREILRLAQEIRFMELLDTYPPTGPDLPDLPPATTTFNDGKQRKTILNRYEAPPALLRFEQLLDQLAQKLDWQPKVE
jgi:hypothetical protein